MDGLETLSSIRQAGQVCDRCRLKKVKCDGTLPACGHCVAAGSPCIVSAKLRRKTKIRGYQQLPNHHMPELREEIVRLQNTIIRQRESATELQRRVDDLTQALDEQTIQFRRLQLESTGQQSPSALQSLTQLQRSVDRNGNSPIMKHMGRLVSDTNGSERFAGSTTGVHFILSAQQAIMKCNKLMNRFPENCYRLHLLCPSNCCFPTQNSIGIETGPMSLLQILEEPLDFYEHQIKLFTKHWTMFCPIICDDDLLSKLAEALPLIQQGQAPIECDITSVVHQVMCITLINSLTSNDMQLPQTKSAVIVQFLRSTVLQLGVHANVNSIQAMVLFALLIQVTGQVGVMPLVNGLLVRSAHSIGLHRHTRRFRFNAGQIELRKRIWWFIYIFDKISSITLGLPQLIQDADVDVDYPVDCDLRASNVDQLSFPLPGETTPVSGFIAICHLGQILAGILDQLYTTTQRRGGGENMSKIRHDLDTWKQRFSNVAVENGHGETHAPLWPIAIAHLATVLIYRPGLTFSETTPEFQESLSQCVHACTALVELLSSPAGKTTLVGFAPLNASLLFQCALMHIYGHLLLTVQPTLAWKDVNKSSSARIVRCTAKLLSEYIPSQALLSGKQVEDSNDFEQALGETSRFLLVLSEEILSHHSTTCEGFTREGVIFESDVEQYVSSSGLIQSTIEAHLPQNELPELHEFFEDLIPLNDSDSIFSGLLESFQGV